MNFGCGDDDSFGPAVRGCRGDFDFTVRFEQLVLAIIPPAVFVALVVPRVVSLLGKPLLVKGTALLASKVVAIVSLAALQIGMLALSTHPGRFKTLLTASSSLALASSACMLLVSWLEHIRSPRPSILLAGYLFLSILFDVAMLRTFWLARSPSSAGSTASTEATFCRLFSAALATKTAILGLESVHKTRYIRPSAAWWQSVAHSPEETSGLFGIGAYAWLSTLFFRGYRNVMILDDLFALDTAMSSKKLERKLAAATASTPGRTYDFGRKKNGLLKALVRALAVDLLLPVAPRLALAGFLFGQPFLINATLAYLDDPTAPKNHSYGLIGATFLIYIGISVSTAVHYYYQERAMFMVRGALAAAVYRKTTELPLTDAPTDANDGHKDKSKQSTASASLTLMSTDVERIRTGFLNIHEYWANIMQIGVACWLLMRTLGSAGAFVAPLVVIFLSVGVMSSVAVLTGKRQRAWMAVIQKRVAMTSNAIAHMKQLKMLGLAMPTETLIQKLRVQELHVGSQFRMVLCIALAVAYTPQMFSPVFAFAFTLGGSASLEPAQTAEIFTALSFIVLVAMPFVTVLQGVPNVLAALACLGRVQDFLEKDPRDDFRGEAEAEASLTSSEKGENGRNDGNDGNDETTAVTIDAAHIGWGADKFHMSDVQLKIPAGKLTIVVGPIASGKSTLCKALLGEVPFYQAAAGRPVLQLKNGLLPSGGQRVGYCDQEPFLFNATVRENIIGIVAPDDVAENAQPTPPFDDARYREAISAAMLLSDLAQLPEGDRTKVGSNGITLSGGQRQRVSIARALYGGTAAEGLYIFDDVLSGLDADTEEQVFDRVFGPLGLLRNRGGATTVLCTHSVRHLPAADHVVALDVQGRIVEQGTFEDLMANRKYIHSLGVTAKTASSHGSSSGHDAEITEIAEITESSSDTIEPVVAAPKDIRIFQAEDDPENPTTAEERKQQANRALGDMTVYRHYFSRIGVLPLVGFNFLGLGFGFLYNWGTVWIKFWVADAGSGDPSTQQHSTAYYLGMYGLFQVLGLVCLFFVALIVFRTMILLSGATLHHEALQTVVRAPLRFFTTTDNGVITNLFSQDITLIDGDLPHSFANFGVGCFLVLCMAAVIATSSPYLVIVYPFILAVFWALQRFYLRTSRQLRLLDLEAKSPLYTHFIDTMKGLATFRAYGWATSTAGAAERAAGTSEKWKASGIIVKDSVAVAVNDQLLDRSQRPAYLLAMIQRWLAFSLNVLVAVMATVVVTLATLVRFGGGSHTAFTGASLVLLMSFGEEIGYIMSSYTQLETSIGAVSRLKTFSETVKGEGHDDGAVVRDLPPHWPTGHVKLENVSASYFGEDEAHGAHKKGGKVLDGVSLDIRAGDKVAICGRTGSGKSSTILLLLRLLNPLEGSSIVIDGIPLASVDRIALRERIIAVPQDAVFLPDGTTFRQNLDPFGGFATTFTPAHAAMCQAVLETVDLWTFVQERGGLDAGMVADTLSQGQRQLFSLGRAIFRRRSSALAASDSGILLVDELSSSVDLTTDRAMQALIQSEFAAYTIIMVSHRLDMVLATCNRVVVLDQGRVVETGEPSELVNAPGTRFRELWLLGGGH